MNQLTSLTADLSAFWTAHGYQIILGALAVVAAVLIAAFVVAQRRGRTDKWLALLCNFAVLGLSAEGMWMFARDQLKLPPVIAAGVFFFAEALMVASARRARRHYQATSTYETVEEDGETKRVMVKPGHPGKHGTAVWVIAAIAGCMVATNAGEWQEIPFRILLPLGAAYMWWNEMTADGTSRPVGVWRWTPRRLLVRLGAIDPTEQDLPQADRERRIAAMTVTARRVHTDTWPGWWHLRRLERLAHNADPEMVAAVQRQVALVAHIKQSTAPDTAPAIEPAVEQPLQLPAAPAPQESPAPRPASAVAATTPTSARVTERVPAEPPAAAEEAPEPVAPPVPPTADGGEVDYLIDPRRPNHKPSPSDDAWIAYLCILLPELDEAHGRPVGRGVVAAATGIKTTNTIGPLIAATRERLKKSHLSVAR